MDERVEHWFNRRYGIARRDVYLIRTPMGWQVLGREGGSEGREVAHYFDEEGVARQMLRRMLETVPSGQDNWALMSGNAVRDRET
ncbi:hypothetical protein [Actinoplanes sp. NPDC089786]|uniref:hypothetical protein n=1 Tax=Actinoplanes sp. NPDC089786 TaxID=3155185 RepID=UPI0034393DCE